MLRTIVPDKLTALTAAQAITAALLARERGGGGQHVRLAMLDAVIAFMWPEGMARHTFLTGDRAGPRRGGPRQLRDLVFETADGYMTAGAVSNREWAALATALGHEEWTRDPRFATETARIVHWDERLERVGEVLKTRTTGEWVERLDRAGVPCAPILSRRDLLEDPQVAHNELIVESEHPHAGPMRQTRPAARFGATPAEIRRPAPALGEHTDEILREIGFDDGEIGRLRNRAVVA
jgi:crotonobetainyl-CoA:carnitine CoA-transferase CaiB-like acyl-CoA transferase